MVIPLLLILEILNIVHIMILLKRNLKSLDIKLICIRNESMTILIGLCLNIWISVCLMKFVEFYYEKYKPKSLKKAYELGENARHIRNACAHNSVFILNIFNDDNKLENVHPSVSSLAKKAGVLKYKNYKKSK